MTKKLGYVSKVIAKIDFPKQDKITRHFGLILIERETKYGMEYITWIKYLDAAGGNASGNYFKTLGAALRDFHNRAETWINYIERKEAMEKAIEEAQEGEKVE